MYLIVVDGEMKSMVEAMSIVMLCAVLTLMWS